MNTDDLVKADAALVDALEGSEKPKTARVRKTALDALRAYAETYPKTFTVARGIHKNPDGTTTTKEITSLFGPRDLFRMPGLLGYTPVKTFRIDPKAPNRQRNTELHGRQKVMARKAGRRIAKILSED